MKDEADGSSENHALSPHSDFDKIQRLDLLADNDPLNFHPSPPRKSYNPFDSDDDALDSPGLKSENMQVKENFGRLDLKVSENTSNTVIFHMDNGDFLWEEAMLGQCATSDHTGNANANGNTSLFAKEGQLYTDKNVTECELPEFIVCYKESTIKDIGVDEGVPSHNKLWVQSGDDEDKYSSAFLALSSKSDDNLKIGKNNHQLSVLEVPKSTLGSDWQKVAVLYNGEHPVKASGLNEEGLSGQYLVHEFGNDDLLKISELKLDLEVRTPTPADQNTKLVETVRGDLVYDLANCDPATEMESDKNACEDDESDFIVKVGLNHDDKMVKKGNDTAKNKVDNISAIQDSTTTQSPSELSTEQGAEVMPKESPNKEEILPNSQEHVALQESADSHDSNKMAYDSKVESRSITFEFNSSTNSEPGKQEDEPGGGEVAKPPSTQTMTRQEGNSSSTVVSRLEERVHGETSFSAGRMPVSPPSSMMFSDPLTYSGSISLRSESSAGSTRSFAFPVLQREWNSSPERMGKPGQRHFKKHRSWVHALNCCKL